MPNWCNNYIEITGPAKTVNALWTAATAEDSGLLNAMVPMPAELSNTVKGSGDELQTEKYDGYTNWYDWAVDRWGTKWDVDIQGLEYMEEDGVVSISGYFESAWAPPIDAIRTYASANPNVSITLDYHEPGMAFVGRYIIEDGEEEDESYEYNETNSKTVRSLIGEDIDDFWSISEDMANWEEEIENENM
jgi:hypothetical protein